MVTLKVFKKRPDRHDVAELASVPPEPDVAELLADHDVVGLHQAFLRAQTIETMRAAAWALTELDDPAAVEPLIDALRFLGPKYRDDCEANRDARAAVARALGRLGDPRAIEPLLAAYKDGIKGRSWHGPTLAVEVAHALVDLGDEGAGGLVCEPVGQDLALEVLEDRGLTTWADRMRTLETQRIAEIEEHYERRQRAEREAREREEKAARELRRRIADIDNAADAVSILVSLYDANPEGFITGEAPLVEMVGERVDAIGGFRLMQEVHREFAAERPRMARNLEMVWDRVGMWSG